QVHTFVRLRFTVPPDADLKYVGYRLDRLGTLRNQADYQTATPGQFADAQRAATGVPLAQEVIDRLDAINADPARVAAAVAAIRVGRIPAIAVIGDDGEGYELRQALAALPAVDAAGVVSWPGRRTPTYTKPMLCESGRPPRELNRLDIKNRTPTPHEAEERA